MCLKYVCNIFRIKMMTKYKRIATDTYVIFSEPSDSLANIFNIFACCSYNQVSWMCFFKFLCHFRGNIGFCLCCECAIMGVYLPIMNATDPTFCEILFLQTIASNKSANITERH